FRRQSLYHLARKRNSHSTLPELGTIQLKRKVLLYHHPLEIDTKEHLPLDKHTVRPVLVVCLSRSRGTVFPLIVQGQQYSLRFSNGAFGDNQIHVVEVAKCQIAINRSCQGRPFDRDDRHSMRLKRFAQDDEFLGKQPIE